MTFGVQSLSSIKKIGGLKGGDPKWQKGLLVFFKRGEKEGRKGEKKSIGLRANVLNKYLMNKY